MAGRMDGWMIKHQGVQWHYISLDLRALYRTTDSYWTELPTCVFVRMNSNVYDQQSGCVCVRVRVCACVCARVLWLGCADELKSVRVLKTIAARTCEPVCECLYQL
ncbi:hypothetical protein JOB18_004758 [Solea senegalensis]|uniref:Uncharacterized protein n=1 Tax=Solea senegalensis TaxID=28829 RepID=A0AAV6QUF5_SOLSE|nr:hypothetical protein JOB18_004758 [Solea senegalensis]